MQTTNLMLILAAVYFAPTLSKERGVQLGCTFTVLAVLFFIAEVSLKVLK